MALTNFFLTSNKASKLLKCPFDPIAKASSASLTNFSAFFILSFKSSDKSILVLEKEKKNKSIYILKTIRILFKIIYLKKKL